MDYSEINLEHLKSLNVDELRKQIVNVFNSKTNKNFDCHNISFEDFQEMHKFFLTKAPFFIGILPSICKKYFCIDDKVNRLSQAHCPLCSATTPMAMISIETPIFSHPIRLKAKKIVAQKFKEELSSRKYSLFSSDDRICLLILFSLSSKSNNKDIDNMAKHIIDVFKHELYGDDTNIDHLNCIKLRNSTDNDVIHLNIRKSDLACHMDVLFPYSNAYYDWKVK